MSLQVKTISRDDSRYPASLVRRIGESAPAKLTALGSLDLLTQPKVALFCSARCPGNVILPTYDQAAKWRDAGRCVISGFHSPVEKECLRILLRGTQPIVICPARSLPQRVPPEWREPLTAGRLLIVSAFADRVQRVTAELAGKRNEFVAALADEVFIPHATVGGHLEELSRRVNAWHNPLAEMQSALQNPA